MSRLRAIIASTLAGSYAEGFQNAIENEEVADGHTLAMLFAPSLRSGASVAASAANV
jgi:hypothetical protein